MNNKRPYEVDRRYGHGNHKKQRHDGGGGYKQTSKPHHSSQDSHHHRNDRPRQSQDYNDAIAQLPPPTSTLPPIPPYTPFTVLSTLPPLPEILDPTLASAPFRHKSTTATYTRSATASPDTTYEKLEFLGDAQLELLASRLLYTRYNHLTSGQQSQLRELLVKNETLAGFARAYGFEKRVQVGDMERMVKDAEQRAGNKAFNKVLGDVFEAYVAAVVLSQGDEGWAVAEKWMLGLWAPRLVEAAGKDRNLLPASKLLVHDGEGVDAVGMYNPAAKAELQKMVLGGKGVKLDYEPYQKSVELKGDMLGQNRHFIAVYLTGYGYERLLLGKGEGKNKVEAGNWAAQVAMFGEQRGVVEECAKELEVFREQRRREKEEVEKGAAAAAEKAAT